MPSGKERKSGKGSVTKSTRQDPWLTVTSAAELLERSRVTVYAMIGRRELRVKSVAGRTVVNRADVEARRAELTAGAA